MKRGMFERAIDQMTRTDETSKRNQHSVMNCRAGVGVGGRGGGGEDTQADRQTDTYRKTDMHRQKDIRSET